MEGATMTTPLADEGATRPPSYYAGYAGYDPGFLRTPVPLPPLTDEQRRAAARRLDAKPDEDPAVLPYTHFSVVINRLRQLALYTVVNIDGDSLVELERGRDKWFFDPRIAESEQIGEELYQRNALDRGHLVRRRDPVWGAEPQRPNDDTFHFTNCSPQHEKFNQGQDLWQGLENYYLGNAELRDRRMSVFTGPVLDDDDPIYKGVRLPLAFWKVIVYDRADGTLATAAYSLEQAKLVEEMLRTRAMFDPGTYRITLAELGERTGLDFGYLAEFEVPVSIGGLERGLVSRVKLDEDYANVVL
jgi:endonuclease G, mitochondrial